jgi:hypothetical protein
VDCAAQGLTCGWKATLGWYDCNETSQPDPSGTFPLWCPGICPPECDGKECGPDGCGGTCGECQEGEKCVNALCVGDCEPDCDGQSCGDDGCGGQCECQIGMVCYFGQCVNSCIPQCTDLECGDDGCEGLCGQCAPGMSCSGGQCILGQVDDDVREESDTLQEIAPNAAPASGGCSARGGADSWGMLLLIWLVLLVALSRRTSRA